MKRKATDNDSPTRIVAGNVLVTRHTMECTRFGSESWLRGTMNVVGNSIQIGHADCSHLARLLPELRRYADERGLDWWRDLVEPRASGMPRAFVEHLEAGASLAGPLEP